MDSSTQWYSGAIGGMIPRLAKSLAEQRAENITPEQALVLRQILGMPS
jgi:hypothetical protein